MWVPFWTTSPDLVSFIFVQRLASALIVECLVLPLWGDRTSSEYIRPQPSTAISWWSVWPSFTCNAATGPTYHLLYPWVFFAGDPVVISGLRLHYYLKRQRNRIFNTLPTTINALVLFCWRTSWFRKYHLRLVHLARIRRAPRQDPVLLTRVWTILGCLVRFTFWGTAWYVALCVLALAQHEFVYWCLPYLLSLYLPNCLLLACG